MGDPVTIALDAMGGDHGPSVVIPAAAIALVRHPNTRFILVGDRDQIAAELKNHTELAAKSEIVHSDIAIAMDAKPSQALRNGRWKSSMWLAIQAVRDGQADSVVSAGNTGALMAMAKFCLKTIKGIDRPAIAAIWPTVDAECIVLDVGANVGADTRQLVEFALMGGAMARALLGMDKPSIGLLNIGVEEVKGVEQIREAAAFLKSAPLPIRYHGFIEGDDIGHGAVDVVVTDGYTGNIALKTAEGTAKQIAQYLRAAMSQSFLSRLGAVLAQGAFRALKEKMDPRQLNGGIFLGLNGIVVKSHGGTDATGFASAVDLAYEMASSGVVKRLGDDIAQYHDKLELDGAA
ncbi:MAG: phosphate acyltransferase PlsX [Methyloceanibacter sp.]|uniref:phosphate acyltransferase PlsX n=1 Tax=Methyloceanibacter sp. TaxID=1965321 RepID=UPI001D225478|nr:phosphate acyltransferase PlsX [Methyloceanibacter sp.]MCB1443018.1 phosphate acyltransferase PlsX [Methyloceanibacter sp.]MCC0058109.1 phosphate acyltransferase PlsX [Hyphomicrobiaceae bacterium]